MLLFTYGELMEHPYPSIEFEAEIGPAGTIKIPVHVTKKLKKVNRVTIRLTEGVVSKTLQRRCVTEDEIEQIAELQLERRENIIRFLESEGVLADNRLFLRRAAARMKKDK